MSDRANDRAATGGTDKIIGEVLANRYQIETRLGEGAMGAVYKAKHVKVGRAFAVKVLHAKLLEDHKIAQRFEREAELAGRLRHPNVVGVVDVGETADGLRYMVMDFAHGPDLAALLVEAPMPAPRVLHLTRQLLEGLYHAHEAGLIHRDFKPENVIIEKDAHGDEVPRIVDFGIAILREGGDSPDSQGRLTTNGLVLGTPHYMAPEQAVADPIDHRIDLFALGIVIYEMLCGKLPFDGTGAEVARANLLLDPPLISQRVPYLEVDPLLEAFARRLMAKKRDARPATAKAARELLDLIAKDRSAAAAALGVPLTTARGPAVTAPSAPQPRTDVTSNDTFPIPALSSAQQAAQAKKAGLLSGDLDPEKYVTTAPISLPNPATSELEPVQPRKKRPVGLYVAAGGGVIAALVALILVLGGEKKAAPPAAPVAVEDKQPVTPPPPDKQPDEQVALDPTPLADAGVEVVVDAAPVEVKRPDKGTPKQQTPPKKDPKQVAVKQPEVIKQPEIKQPEVKVPEAKPPEVKPATDKATVASQYGRIGSKLKALGADAEPLWIPYRRIKIQEAMRDDAQLAEAAKILAKLQSEIAQLERKK